MSSKKTCTAQTKSGKRCRRMPGKNSDVCSCHKSSRKIISVFQDKCPVCLDDDGDFFKLSCSHTIHLVCSEGLVEAKCPICREKILNFPEKLNEKISENAEKYKQEIITEETEALQFRENNLRQSGPQVEFISAIRDLIAQGVPHQYIPQSIDINNFGGMFHTGMIYSTVVGQTHQLLMEAELNGEFDYDDTSDDDDDEIDDDVIYEARSSATINGQTTVLGYNFLRL